ncbi:uncharacterized protein LOC121374358 [Gigantopelta aegis]|uniref:uncharacterized protein LOC121374358 n=1 Tax=Gigantopelta aegis TaxID=1735272 RepID=UPI001B88DC05|nr:uncharacterized protein LOC121374358 [Gigantopelta aegis]XP_041357392.1 uncharacterized protein LOC121374358 [Gigantopelta aegis]
MTTGKVLELERVIGKHAWKLLEKRSGFFRKLFLNEADYYAVVDWKSLDLEHNIMKFSQRPLGKTFDTAWGQVTTGSKWVPLYSCDYENDTETKQVHTFRGQRETTTWVAVELNQCYTVDNEVGIEVHLPNNYVKLRAGRDNTMHVDRIKGQVFKEIVTWEVNSQIEVSPGWKAKAELLAQEDCHRIDFEVRTSLSVKKDKLPVTFKRKADDSVAYVVEVDDFCDAFRSADDGGQLAETEMDVVQVLMETTIDEQGNENSFTTIQLITRGVCTSVAWSDQKVDIKTSPLKSSEIVMGRDVFLDQNGLPSHA